MQEVRRCLGDKDMETIDGILELFREVDAAAVGFQGLTGIRCPDGCGECCVRSRVETTAVEMLPLALELWNRNEAEFWLSRLVESAGSSVCVFYRADPGNPLKGRCEVYAFRPLICRLFGYLTVRNKYGKYVYGSCRVIKQKDPETYIRAVRLISDIEHPSVSTDYAIRIIGMDAGFGARMEPINTAASVALSRIGYRLDLTRLAG
jgi:Fe-S-cluster containining protein